MCQNWILLELRVHVQGSRRLAALCFNGTIVKWISPTCFVLKDDSRGISCLIIFIREIRAKCVFVLRTSIAIKGQECTFYRPLSRVSHRENDTTFSIFQEIEWISQQKVNQTCLALSSQFFAWNSRKAREKKKILLAATQRQNTTEKCIVHLLVDLNKGFSDLLKMNFSCSSCYTHYCGLPPLSANYKHCE